MLTDRCVALVPDGALPAAHLCGRQGYPVAASLQPATGEDPLGLGAAERRLPGLIMTAR